MIWNELEFWEIDKKYVSECCFVLLYRYDDDIEILKEIKNLQNGKFLDILKEECWEGCWCDCLWKVLQYLVILRKVSVSLYIYIVIYLNVIVFILYKCVICMNDKIFWFQILL